jgi:hypothetical protein
VQHTARVRLQAALRKRTTRLDPLQPQNGDQFLFWRSGPGNTTGIFKGPAVCLGQHRALVLGFQGGHVVTAHVSRCILHRRASLAGEPLDKRLEFDVPQNRDSLLEEPLEAAE